MIPLILAKLAGPIVGPVATAGCMALGVLLLVSSCENRGLERKLEKADQRTAVAVGNYNQCRATREGLEASLKGQNAAVEALRRQGEAVKAELERAARVARADAAKATSRAATIMARRPTGIDACARAMEADRLISEFAK